MSEPLVSICIPAYEMSGQGADYLVHSFEVLRGQTFTDFEVVVADQSEDDSISKVCSEYSDLPIRHIWTRDLPRQASANTNAALDAARGEIVKILFQDDYLNGRDSLRALSQAFMGSEARWCVTGAQHTEDGSNLVRRHVPKYHANIQFGLNTISSPSVVSIRRSETPRFDQNLVWLMDVDFYKQCEVYYGHPLILENDLVINRIHKDQASERVDAGLIRKELIYVKDKYRKDLDLFGWCHFAGRYINSWV